MRAAIAKLVQSAIKTVGDIAETITYNSKTTGDYNAETGETNTTTTEYAFNAIVSSTHDVDASVHLDYASEVREGITSDLSILFATYDLPIEPDSSDTIRRQNGEKYKITKITQDPASASTKLYVVRIG